MTSLTAIRLFFAHALGILSKVPREIWYALAALIAWYVFSSHYESKGYDRRTAEYEALIEIAQQKAAEGDVAAEEAAQVVVDAIEADNARARDAAAECDDVLKCGLDAL